MVFQDSFASEQTGIALHEFSEIVLTSVDMEFSLLILNVKEARLTALKPASVSTRIEGRGTRSKFTPKQLKRLTEFLSDLTKNGSQKPPEVVVETVSIPDKVQKFMDRELPNEYLQHLAQVFLYFFDSFPENISVASRVPAFQKAIDGYGEIQRQIFLVTTITNSQVDEMLEQERGCMYFSERAQAVDEQVASLGPEVEVVSLSSEVELTDFQIKGKIERFAEEMHNGATAKTRHLFGLVSLISSQDFHYLYLVYCDYTAKEMYLLQLRGKRKFEKEIAGEWVKAAAAKKLKLHLLEDISRNRMLIDYPDLFLSYLQEQVVLGEQPFLKSLRCLQHSLFDFLPAGDIFEDEVSDLDEEKLAKAMQMQHQMGGAGMDESGDGGMEEIGSDFDEPPAQGRSNPDGPAKGVPGPTKPQKKETDFDEDNFDDTNVDFDDEYADLQDDF